MIGYLVLQTTNLDGFENHPQVSTACGRSRFSIARSDQTVICEDLASLNLETTR